MNYRHAFHAGNVADCMKHALLVWLLRALARKDKPFAVLDTHAGAGFYDIDSQAAQRTGEAQQGIGRVRQARPAALADYLGVVEGLGLYPGSPAIIRALLRPGDALSCCELHGEEHAALRRRFGRDPAIAIHLRDGYAALGALLPPPQRRGLVLLDPPYEQMDEFARLAAGLATAAGRFPGGVLAAWYPLKHRAPVRDFQAEVRAKGLRDVVAAELWLRPPLDPARLNGCGMLLVNPPFGFEAKASAILAALAACLGEGPEAGWALDRIVDE